MAKAKRQPQSSPTDPPGSAPPEPLTAAPDATTFELENLPPELFPAGDAEPVSQPPVVVAPPPLVVPPSSPPSPVAETPPAPGSLLGFLAEARRKYVDTLERLRTEEAAKQTKTAPVFEFQDANDFDALPSLNTALKTGGTALGKAILAQVHGLLDDRLAQSSHENRVARLRLSDMLWTRFQPDYKDTIKAAGLDKAIAVDPTGRPLHPEQYDPVFHQMLLYHADPGQYAYDLGKEILTGHANARAAPGNGRGTSVTEAAKEAGKQAALTELETAAARPRGIAGLMPSGRTPRTLTLDDISTLNDAQKNWIRKNRPDIWEQRRLRASGL